MAGRWRRGMLAGVAGWMAAQGAAAAWVLDHEEDFATARALDAAYWQLEIGLQRNREEQYYTSTGNLSIEPGFLRLQARAQEVPNAAWRAGSRDWRSAQRTARYTSAALLARRPLQFGRVEVVARTPTGAGVWPAIWLLHEGSGVYGEIDILETVGKHPDTVFAGVHYGRDPRTRQHRNDSRTLPGFDGQWHTHTLEWTPARIRVALDGQPWFSFDPGQARQPGGADPLRQPMRLHINLALGGNWGGPIDPGRLPANLDIASVRIWRWLPGEEDVAPPATAVLPADAPAADQPAPPPEPAPMRWGR